MLQFEIPEGFNDDEVAIQVPKEYILEFLEYLQGQGYKIEVAYLFRWANERASEDHQIYFHYKDCRSIQAFTEESYMYEQHTLVDMHILEQSTTDCEELLNLL